MYNVSDNYKKSMAGQIRNRSYVEATLVNIDVPLQSTIDLITISCMNMREATSGLTSPWDTSNRYYATFEQNYMKASGLYTLRNSSESRPRYFISSDLSASTPNADGEYAILDCGFAAKFGMPNSLPLDTQYQKPMTIVTDGICKSVYIKFSYSGTEKYKCTKTMDGNTLVLDGLPQFNYDMLEVTVKSLSKPNRRARIYKLFCGLVEMYSAENMMEVSCSDVNDTVMLELPEKKLSTTMQNIYGLSPITELQNPRYARLNTQLMCRVGYDVDDSGTIEWVPTGRWFLDSYKVTETKVSFTWVSSLSVLHEYKHYWCKPDPAALSARLAGIMAIDTPPFDRTMNQYIKCAAQTYGMTLDKTALANSSQVMNNPCPIVSSAEALQLYSNATGNRLRILRDLYDLSIEAADLNKEAAMALLLYECFDIDSFESKDLVRYFTVNLYQLSSTTSTKELASGVSIGNAPDIYTSDKPVKNIAVSNGFVTSYPYAYCYYIQCYGELIDDAKVTATQYEVNKISRTKYMSSQGGKVSLDNPLVDGKSITEDAYTRRMYDVLKHNVVLTRNHRGYPALDAGDIITVDIDGKLMRALVTENKWTLSGGAMSGSTKARLL